MRYYARVGASEYEIVIEKEQVWVNDELIDVDMRQSGVPELYSMLFNGASYELLIEAERFEYAVTLLGEQFHIQIEDERTRKLNRGRTVPALPHGELAVTAPIPGLIVKVLVEAGEKIEEEQPLVILEAMKMENEIRAQRSGIVKGISVVPGQRVEQNAPLLILE